MLNCLLEGAWLSYFLSVLCDFHTNLIISTLHTIWFPRILSDLTLGLLIVIYQVYCLDSCSFLLFPVSILEALPDLRHLLCDSIWLTAIHPLWLPLSMLGSLAFVGYNHPHSLFLVAADAKLFHPALGVSDEKEQKKNESIVLHTAGHLYFWIALLCVWCNCWSCFAECELCPPTGV